MKKLLLTLVLSGHTLLGHAQMFNPSASALPDGVQGENYIGQQIDFTVPQTATISGTVVEQALGFVFPQTQPVLGFLNLGSQSFNMLVDRTSLLIQGLPNGIAANCDATPCTYISGASGYVTLEGTPAASGQFTVNILTLSEGNVDISAITGGLLSSFGLPTSLDLPTPVPSSLDEEGYTMTITNPNGIEEVNDLYSLALFPNPTIGESSLMINTREQGLAIMEVYSITGALVFAQNVSVRVGQNRIQLNLNSLHQGMYLIKVNINGKQALIRTEKL